MVALVSMQMRSVAASTAPNAQQLPQSLWSRIIEMDAHCGHCSRASNVSGSAESTSTCFTGSILLGGVFFTPISRCICGCVMPMKRELMPAVHVLVESELMRSAICWWRSRVDTPKIALIGVGVICSGIRADTMATAAIRHAITIETRMATK